MSLTHRQNFNLWAEGVNMTSDVTLCKENVFLHAVIFAQMSRNILQKYNNI